MLEFFRVIRKKFIIIFTIAFIVNLFLFGYVQSHGRTFTNMHEENKQYNYLIQRYQDMELSEALDKTQRDLLLTGSIRRLDNLNPLSAQEEELFLQYYKSLSDFQRLQLREVFKKIDSKLEYLIGYKESIQTIFTNADTMKKRRLFINTESYAYRNIEKTKQDFSRVKKVILPLNNDKAAEAFTSYHMEFYILFALMIFILYQFQEERENGMWSMIHLAKEGRFMLALKRFLILCVSSFVLAASLYFSVLAEAFWIYGGKESLTAPIQTLPSFRTFSYAYTQLTYFICLFLFSWLSILVCTVLLWMCFNFFRNRNFVIVTISCLFGIEYLLYSKIDIHNVYQNFKYMNIINLFQINEIYRQYQNSNTPFGIFSIPFLLMSGLLLLLCITTFVSFLCYTKKKPIQKESIIHKIFRIPSHFYQKIFTNSPLILKELHKILFTSKGIVIVGIALLLVLYFSAGEQRNNTSLENELDSIYLENGGKEFSYIENLTSKYKEAYEQALQNYQSSAEKYQKEEIDIQELNEAYNKLQYNKEKMEGVNEFDNKLQYVDTIKQNLGINLWMISDRGYNQILGPGAAQRELILLMISITAIMLIVSNSFSIEYKSNMEHLLHTTAYGRKLWIKKWIACTGFTVIFTLLVYGIDFWMLYHMYGMPYRNAPVLSLSFIKINYITSHYSIHILGWIILITLLKLIALLAAMAVSILISFLMGKKMNQAVLPITLAIVILVEIIAFHFINVGLLN